MCDLIITNVLPICPVDPSPKRKNGSVVLCHTLTTKYTLVPMPKQNEEKSFFFQRMKANKFVFCNVCLYEQSNNDIFEVQSIITTHTSGLNFECSISIFSLDASSEKSYHWLKERNMCGNAVNIQYAPLRMENMILK